MYLRKELEHSVERFRKDRRLEYKNQAILGLLEMGLSEYERQRGKLGEPNLTVKVEKVEVM